MKTLILILAMIMTLGVTPSVFAVDYSDKGKVITTGYDGYELGTKDLSKLAAWQGGFLLLAFTDWPIGKIPSFAVVSASGLVLLAQRKEMIDSELGIESAKVKRLAKEPVVYGFMTQVIK